MRRWDLLRATCLLLAPIAVVATGMLLSGVATGATAGTPTSVLIGRTVVQARRVSNAAGRAEASRMKSSATGRLTSIRLYVDSHSRATSVTAGLYSDGRGHPRRRITFGVLRSAKTGHWASIRVRAVTIRAGHVYWLVVLGRGRKLSIRARRGTSCRAEQSRQAGLRSLPSSWRAGSRRTLCSLSVYGIGHKSAPAGTRKPAPGGTPTTTAPVTSPATPPGSPVACALTHAAGADGTSSCWATHTGVQGSTGYTEAQIESGAAPGFTHVARDVTVTSPGTVIDHEWISGCVAINASNVTIKDSLITPRDGDYCEGGDLGTAPSAVNDGGGSAPTGLLIEDTTVDGGNASGNQFGVSIDNGECLRCNVFGFAKNFSTGGNRAASPALFQDSYSHDLSTKSCAGYPGGCTTPAGGASPQCAHDDGFYMNSSTFFTIKHSYSIMTGAGYCVTGAISNLADYGAPHDFTIDNSYMEGDAGADLYTGKPGACGTPNVVITSNAFSNQNGYGGKEPVNYWTVTGNTWKANHIAETRAAFDDPADEC